MAGAGGGWPTPTLTPVGRSNRAGTLAAAGLLTAILALVAISLVDRSGGGPGSQAALVGPIASVMATGEAIATPIFTPTPTPTLEPYPATAPLATPGPSSTPPPRVAVSVGPIRTCPPGSRPDVPGSRKQARPPTDYVSMAFDRASARIVLLGQRGENGPVETWAFDVCTNVWTRMHPKREPDHASFGVLAYDAAADRTIAFPGVTEEGTSRVWAYDLASDTWTEAASLPELDGPVRLSYDPIGGGVVALRLWSPRLMMRYEARADAWQPIAQNRYPLGDEYPLHILLAYDASVDRLLGYELGAVRLFDIRTGTWSSPGSPSPPFWYGGYFSFGGEVAYDEAAQRTILFSAGIVIAYDAAADHWETLYGKPSQNEPVGCGAGPQCRMNHAMVYDPVNERLVVYGGTVRTAADSWWAASDDVLAFDTRSRTWSTLLMASQAKAARP